MTAAVAVIGNCRWRAVRQRRESQITHLGQKVKESVILCVHLGQRLGFADKETEIQGGNTVANGESLLSFARLFSYCLERQRMPPLRISLQRPPDALTPLLAGPLYIHPPLSF